MATSASDHHFRAMKEILDLTPEEIEGIKHSKGRLALAVTPYFVSLMDPTNPNCPIRRQAIPRIEELPSFKK